MPPPRIRSCCPSCAFARHLISTPTTGPLRVSTRAYATPQIRTTRQRKTMWAWLNGPGAVFRNSLPGSTNYLGAYDKSGRLIRKGSIEGKDGGDEASRKEDGQLPPETREDLQPFPLNPYFRSEAVLSTALRDEIHHRVVDRGQTVREVSIALGVDMRRVAAVVRLKTVELNWIKEGKKLVKYYQDAVLGMLPQTPYDKNRRAPRHESINDLPVHPATVHQIFHPTSESRHFTRYDAGRVFHRSLLPAEERIPHPEMVEAAKDRLRGVRPMEVIRLQRSRIEEMEARLKRKEEARRRQEEEVTTVVHSPRWDFRIKDVDAENTTGRNGKSVRGIGVRYGFPHEDRKKGQIKIPTRVD